MILFGSSGSYLGLSRTLFLLDKAPCPLKIHETQNSRPKKHDFLILASKILDFFNRVKKSLFSIFRRYELEIQLSKQDRKLFLMMILVREKWMKMQITQIQISLFFTQGSAVHDREFPCMKYKKSSQPRARKVKFRVQKILLFCDREQSQLRVLK